MRPGTRRLLWFVGLLVVAVILTFAFSGCNLMKGRIKAQGVTVQSPKDGNNASLAQGQSTGVLTLPKGSTLTVTKFGAVAWEPPTGLKPEVKAEPAREETKVVLSADAQWTKEESTVAANTGTIDNTVAVRRIQVAENRYLLFAAIVAAVAGGFFLYIKYPTPAMMCGAASVVFFLAWKLADLPSWFWVVGVAGIGCGIFLYLGHKRGEADGVKAAVTGNLESTPPKVVP